MSEAAAIAGMTQSAFSRFFKKNTGANFVDYSRKLRIRPAPASSCRTPEPGHRHLLRGGLRQYLQLQPPFPQGAWRDALTISGSRILRAAACRSPPEASCSKRKFGLVPATLRRSSDHGAARSSTPLIRSESARASDRYASIRWRCRRSREDGAFRGKHRIFDENIATSRSVQDRSCCTRSGAPCCAPSSCRSQPRLNRAGRAAGQRSLETSRSNALPLIARSTSNAPRPQCGECR